jgi:hypothetical protein
MSDSKMPIPESVFKLSEDKQILIQNYIQQMNEQQKKAYLIAYHHLGSSFNVHKSNGFKEWNAKYAL